MARMRIAFTRLPLTSTSFCGRAHPIDTLGYESYSHERCIGKPSETLRRLINLTEFASPSMYLMWSMQALKALCWNESA